MLNHFVENDDTMGETAKSMSNSAKYISDMAGKWRTLLFSPEYHPAIRTILAYESVQKKCNELIVKYETAQKKDNELIDKNREENLKKIKWSIWTAAVFAAPCVTRPIFPYVKLICSISLRVFQYPAVRIGSLILTTMGLGAGLTYSLMRLRER